MGGVSIPPAIAAPVGSLCPLDVVALLKQIPKVNGSMRVSPFIGTAIGTLGALQVAALLEQQAQVVGGVTVPSAIAAPVGITCLVCEEKIRTCLGYIRVECRCGAEYHVRRGQLVEEPICGLLAP